MKILKQQFKDSYNELRNINTIVITALLIAIGMLLGQFSVQLTPQIKIGVSFIATQLTATLFGPVVGGVMGGVADVLKFIMKPTGAFSILWTLNAVVGPVIYGVLLYKKKLTFWRILVSKVVVAVIVNICMSTAWNFIYIGMGCFAVLPAKLLQQVIQVPIQSLIFYLFVKALEKAKVFTQLR